MQNVRLEVPLVQPPPQHIQGLVYGVGDVSFPVFARAQQAGVNAGWPGHRDPDRPDGFFLGTATGPRDA